MSLTTLYGEMQDTYLALIRTLFPPSYSVGG